MQYLHSQPQTGFRKRNRPSNVRPAPDVNITCAASAPGEGWPRTDLLPQSQAPPSGRDRADGSERDTWRLKLLETATAGMSPNRVVPLWSASQEVRSAGAAVLKLLVSTCKVGQCGRRDTGLARLLPTAPSHLHALSCLHSACEVPFVSSATCEVGDGVGVVPPVSSATHKMCHGIRNSVCELRHA